MTTTTPRTRTVYIIEYHRWDESFVDSVYETLEGAEKALSKLDKSGRRYYTIIEREVYE